MWWSPPRLEPVRKLMQTCQVRSIKHSSQDRRRCTLGPTCARLWTRKHINQTINASLCFNSTRSRCSAIKHGTFFVSFPLARIIRHANSWRNKKVKTSKTGKLCAGKRPSHDGCAERFSKYRAAAEWQSVIFENSYKDLSRGWWKLSRWQCLIISCHEKEFAFFRFFFRASRREQVAQSKLLGAL